MRRPAALAHVDEQIRRLLDLSHPDPHSVLGAHQENGGVVVRAFRPEAERVTLIVEGKKKPVELERAHPGGIFEGKVMAVTRSRSAMRTAG